MAGGPETPPSRARAIGVPRGPRARRGWTRIDPVPPIPPAVRAVAEQFLVAGPIFGVLNAIYTRRLAQTGSAVADPATGEVIRQAAVWHGHVQRAYYITPTQNAVEWALAIPAMAWLLLLLCTVVALGIRSHYLRER